MRMLSCKPLAKVWRESGVWTAMLGKCQRVTVNAAPEQLAEAKVAKPARARIL